jgi:hypothetical protein
MPSESNRNLGPQPLASLMQERGLSPNDLVRASEDQLTHKAVSRAMNGRWLTPNMQDKVRRALERATGGTWSLSDLFSYAGSAPPS